MELVYLWVEDYKNIKKQGFNFSPRFECKYNDETKELTTIDNNYDTSDFFGKDINVTAIVGKNGSGKSNILKFIRLIIDKKVNDGSFLIFYDKTDNKYICIYTSSEIKSNIELEQDTIIFDHILFPMFDYSLTYDASINFQNEQLPIYPKKINESLSFYQELAINKKNIIQNYHILKIKNQLDKFNDFFQPKEIKVIFDLEKLKPKDTLVEKKLEEYNSLINNFKKNTTIKDALILFEKIFNILSDAEAYKKNLDLLKETLKESDMEETLENKKIILPSIDKYSFPSLQKKLLSLEQRNHNSYADGYSGYNIWNNEECKELLFSVNQLKVLTEEHDKYCLFSFDINKLSVDIINIIFDSFPLDYFKIELIDINEKKLSDLSFGEQQLLFILNQIYSLSLKADQDLNYIILFDEIDIGFHPNWQKRTIQYIVDFLNSIDDEKYYHLIFTTHSPFLLSDIPKANIIFLKDGKNDKGINHNQTFGANIHTLLSDSFFMEDGLMGEFAKSKINEIISFHKTVQKKRHTNCLKKIYLAKRKDKFWQTQSIIGEEYLKQVIKNHLVEIEKILLGKDGAKDSEKERLLAQLRELDND